MARGAEKQMEAQYNSSSTNDSTNNCSDDKNNKESGSRLKNSESYAADSPYPIKLNNQNLMEALIYSEILGKPICKRRGRVR